MNYSIFYEGSEIYSEDIDDGEWEKEDFLTECKNYIEYVMDGYREELHMPVNTRNYLKMEYVEFLAIIDEDEYTYEELLAELGELSYLCEDEKYYFELGETVFVHDEKTLTSMGCELKDWSDDKISKIEQELIISKRILGQNHTGIYYDENGTAWEGAELTTTIGKYINKTDKYTNVEVYTLDDMLQVVKLYEGKVDLITEEAKKIRIRDCNKTGGLVLQISIDNKDAAQFLKLNTGKCNVNDEVIHYISAQEYAEHLKNGTFKSYFQKYFESKYDEKVTGIHLVSDCKEQATISWWDINDWEHQETIKLVDVKGITKQTDNFNSIVANSVASILK